MSRKYFGTDGIRGRVGQHPITPDFVLRLGYAAGQVLANRNTSDSYRPGVLIGKDTRNSGYMLEAALEAVSDGSVAHAGYRLLNPGVATSGRCCDFGIT
jgi:phosphomannomutase